MARFPKIDSPCPLGQDELAAIAGHCGRCSRTVHSLDGMDDAGRAALMRQAKGPICVSYRLPVGISAAMALSLAAPAFAQDAAPTHASIRQAVTPAYVVSPAPAAAQAAPANVQANPPEMMITAGGVRVPSDARWTEDMSLPELPTAPDNSISGK
ncbi:MAG TPA: hypothetical protein VK660_05485 [Xanthomonadaceae bacterium]|jgi:hypothetical protein|nr:hypothetical protein [Xanthomonadaceae bacterium]